MLRHTHPPAIFHVSMGTVVAGAHSCAGAVDPVPSIMDSVAAQIRARAAQIANAWETELRRELPQLARLTRPILLDYLPEFLDGLAAWIEDHTDASGRAFDALVKSHAIQRFGCGIGLDTLTLEYSKLRVVLMRELCGLGYAHHSMIRMHEGIDYAIARAVDRYTKSRDEVRERFIGILGHDLRTPIHTIVVSAGILENDAGTPPHLREFAAHIVEAGGRMQRMVGDVLDFARGHLGGGIPANPTPNDMAEICRAARAEVAAAHPDRPIAVDLRGDLRGPFDRDRALQALANLLDNAVKHGSGRIEVRACETADHGAVLTSVTSHGPVLPQPVLDRLFEPFAHGDEPRHGLGLGLYIVEQIALAHGGRCEVTSSPKGTTFTIRWPRTGQQHRAAS
jgi:signal transduction histidine kinase